ncbi:hypothetical protein D3C81_1791710 [compost metagenome]
MHPQKLQLPLLQPYAVVLHLQHHQMVGGRKRIQPHPDMSVLHLLRQNAVEHRIFNQRLQAELGDQKSLKRLLHLRVQDNPAFVAHIQQLRIIL